MLFTKERIVCFLKNKGLTDILLYYTFTALLLKSILVLSIVVAGNHSKIDFPNAFYFDPSMTVYSSFILMVLSFSFLFSGRKRFWYLVLINSGVSVLIVFDLWYYRGYGNFLSALLLGQLTNLENLSSSIISMTRLIDLVFVSDAVLLFAASFWISKYYRNTSRSIILFAFAFIIPLILLCYMHYKFDVKEDGEDRIIFRICWNPPQTISNLSPIGYHIYEIYTSWNDCRKIKLTQAEKNALKKWFEENGEPHHPNKYNALMKGKNLLYIQVESLESFVINHKVNGSEITPTLNRLLANSLYFTDFFEQVHGGTSSDADFMVNTSVYPVRRGSTFFRYPYNSYYSLPKLLKQKGYRTLAIHPDKGTYWNWMPALSSIGFDTCIDLSYFVPDELIGMGLSDGSYLRQVEPIIKKLHHPFYTFMVTGTSHGPFNIPFSYRELHLEEKLDESTLGGYFESIHYTDKQIGLFLSKLKEDGVLNDTVVVISGDHGGIHKFYKDELDDIQPREDWWYSPQKNIPLIIWQLNGPRQVISITGGQIDIFPTLAGLLGIDESLYSSSAMGRNLLNTNKSFAVLDDRSYIGKFNNAMEKQHALDGIDVADLIIRSNYFGSK
jgi:lipoteichoic acid synthase